MAKELHIDAMQSVVPWKLTQPGQSRKININSPLTDTAVKSHLRVVLYYNSPKGLQEGDASPAVTMAAWMKESLGEALTCHPELAGRLRREREGDGFWEVKYNDAGLRMVQASAEVTMEEFLAEKGREEKEEVLVYWVDVDKEHPELASLLNMQVTQFQGDGYSIGFTCSLLLSDALFLSQFLKKWAVAHVRLVAQLHHQKPIFHLDYFGKTKPNRTHLKSIPMGPTTAQPNSGSITTLFKFPWGPRHGPKLTHTQLALLCMQKAAQGKPVSEFRLIVQQSNGEMTVDRHSCQHRELELELVHSDVFNGTQVSWDEFGLHELAFIGDNTPTLVSCRILSCGPEGIVVVLLPKADDDVGSTLIIIATVF